MAIILIHLATIYLRGNLMSSKPTATGKKTTSISSDAAAAPAPAPAAATRVINKPGLFSGIISAAASFLTPPPASGKAAGETKGIAGGGDHKGYGTR